MHKELLTLCLHPHSVTERSGIICCVDVSQAVAIKGLKCMQCAHDTIHLESMEAFYYKMWCSSTCCADSVIAMSFRAQNLLCPEKE